MTMGDVTIEQMQDRHLPDVVRIERDSYPDPWSRDSFSRELAAQPVSVPLVAIRSEAVVGFVVAWFVVDEAHIGNVAVSPQERGNGIGRMMMQYLEEQAIDRGCTYGSLEVRESNVAAKQLYARMGYRPIGRRKEYYRHSEEDAIVMIKTLK